MTKVLVTGSRDWVDEETVRTVLEQFPSGTIVVHGACRGADNTCAAVAEALGFLTKSYPADWSKHGKAAGPIRNQLMLDAENTAEQPIDACLAFHNNIAESKGTLDMVTRAKAAGVPVAVFRSFSCENNKQT